MATSQSQKIAVQKYRAKTYDTIGFDVPKGKREEFKQKAASLGISLAKFLFLSAESYGAKHAGEVVTVKPENQLSAEERKLIDEFNQLPTDAQKHLLKFVKAVNQTKGGGDNGNTFPDSIQAWLPVKNIIGGVVITKDNRFVKIL